MTARTLKDWLLTFCTISGQSYLSMVHSLRNSWPLSLKRRRAQKKFLSSLLVITNNGPKITKSTTQLNTTRDSAQARPWKQRSTSGMFKNTWYHSSIQVAKKKMRRSFSHSVSQWPTRERNGFKSMTQTNASTTQKRPWASKNSLTLSWFTSVSQITKGLFRTWSMALNPGKGKSFLVYSKDSPQDKKNSHTK